MIFYIDQSDGSEIDITHAKNEILYYLDPYFCVYRDNTTKEQMPLYLAIRDGKKDACDHLIKHLKAVRLEDLGKIQELDIIAWDFLLSDEILDRGIAECDRLLENCLKIN